MSFTKAVTLYLFCLAPLHANANTCSLPPNHPYWNDSNYFPLNHKAIILTNFSILAENRSDSEIRLQGFTASNEAISMECSRWQDTTLTCNLNEVAAGKLEVGNLSSSGYYETLNYSSRTCTLTKSDTGADGTFTLECTQISTSAIHTDANWLAGTSRVDERSTEMHCLGRIFQQE